MNDELFMKRAIALSGAAVAHGNEPFGAVLVKDNEIVFENEIRSIRKTTLPSTPSSALSAASSRSAASPIFRVIRSTPAVSPALCVAVRWYGRSLAASFTPQATLTCAIFSALRGRNVPKPFFRQRVYRPPSPRASCAMRRSPFCGSILQIIKRDKRKGASVEVPFYAWLMTLI